MGDITQNISQHELDCKCGKCDVTIHSYEPVIQHWQDCCDHFANKYSVSKVVLEITSGARCFEYNRGHDVGSNDNSQHPRCRAIDGKVFLPSGEQIPPAEIYNYFDNRFPRSNGVGLYSSFTHLDTRPKRARWGI